MTGKPCKPNVKGKERKAAFEEEFNRKAKAARISKEAFVIFVTESEEELEANLKPTSVNRTETSHSS